MGIFNGEKPLAIPRYRRPLRSFLSALSIDPSSDQRRQLPVGILLLQTVDRPQCSSIAPRFQQTTDLIQSAVGTVGICVEFPFPQRQSCHQITPFFKYHHRRMVKANERRLDSIIDKDPPSPCRIALEPRHLSKSQLVGEKTGIKARHCRIKSGRSTKLRMTIGVDRGDIIELDQTLSEKMRRSTTREVGPSVEKPRQIQRLFCIACAIDQRPQRKSTFFYTDGALGRHLFKNPAPGLDPTILLGINPRKSYAVPSGTEHPDDNGHSDNRPPTRCAAQQPQTEISGQQRQKRHHRQ